MDCLSRKEIKKMNHKRKLSSVFYFHSILNNYENMEIISEIRKEYDIHTFKIRLNNILNAK